MTDGYTSASVSVISGVTYGVANEIQAMSGILTETRQYNSMFQLTRITVPSVLDIQYAYPSAGSNSGKLASQTDVLSGEQITYTYDALNRLATAQTTDNPSVTQWGQSYTYDGFGNLTDQNVIKGSAPSMHVVYNASTNRQTGDVADANGNIGSGYLYDIENRLLKPGASATQQYGYDAGNKRVWRGDTGVDEFAFWAGSQKLATYQITVSGSSVRHQLTGTNVYFGGRMIAKGTYNSGGTNDKVTLASIAQDRLGSMNGKFYPYGQERPSATTSDKEKFTGYFRDQASGLHYADQRYHNPGQGRFMTPDYYWLSASVFDPGSINRYAYVGGDPVNGVDPLGLDTITFTTTSCGNGCPSSSSSTRSGDFPATAGSCAMMCVEQNIPSDNCVGPSSWGFCFEIPYDIPMLPPPVVGPTPGIDEPTTGDTSSTTGGTSSTADGTPPTPAPSCNAACEFLKSLGGLWDADWTPKPTVPTAATEKAADGLKTIAEVWHGVTGPIDAVAAPAIALSVGLTVGIGYATITASACTTGVMCVPMIAAGAVALPTAAIMGYTGYKVFTEYTIPYFKDYFNGSSH